jgi:hypothetical protein
MHAYHSYHVSVRKRFFSDVTVLREEVMVHQLDFFIMYMYHSYHACEKTIFFQRNCATTEDVMVHQLDLFYYVCISQIICTNKKLIF